MTPGTGIIGEGAAVTASFARYRGAILPRVHRQLEEWRRAAAAIPDPILRGQAVGALDEKASNVEAIAVFAGLAPRRSRPTVIRAATALQVAVDYLDTLGEEPGHDQLGDGLQLHGALAAALDPAAETRDWYAHHPRREDGGYLERLIAACGQAAASLPSAAAILPLAGRAIARCGEGQSYTHATADGSPRELRRWAAELPAPPGFEWWEVAAGASSSVAAHALLALAGTPGATAAQAELVDRAYFPSIGALTVLLDDLVDREADEAGGEHSYLRHYPSDAVATERLSAIVGLADRSISLLPRAGRHRAILSGVLAFYLSSPGAAAPGARMVRDRLLASSGPTVKALAWALRRKRPGPAGSGPGL